MNISTTPLHGFIPAPPILTQSPSSRCRRRRHYYADVFGVAYGFYSQGARDAFVARIPSARVLEGRMVNGHGVISRYRFVVVCRSIGHAMRFVDALVR